jgi:hypothetical protein
VRGIDTCVELATFPLFSAVDYLHKSLHVGIFFEVSEKLEQEKADRGIGKSG